MSKEKLFYLPVGVLTAATMISGAVLSGAASFAVETKTEGPVTVGVTVAGACSLTAEDYTTTMSVMNDEIKTTESDEDKPSMMATCNDVNGFSITAIGASDSVTVSDNTAYTNYMVGSNGFNIATGTTGDDSYWAMKIDTDNGEIKNDYDDYNLVPNGTATEILRVEGSTSGAAKASVRADYKVHISRTQRAGNYTGKVKYTLTHPAIED